MSEISEARKLAQQKQIIAGNSPKDTKIKYESFREFREDNNRDICLGIEYRRRLNQRLKKQPKMMRTDIKKISLLNNIEASTVLISNIAEVKRIIRNGTENEKVLAECVLACCILINKIIQNMESLHNDL